MKFLVFCSTIFFFTVPLESSGTCLSLQQPYWLAFGDIRKSFVKLELYKRGEKSKAGWSDSLNEWAQRVDVRPNGACTHPLTFPLAILFYSLYVFLHSCQGLRAQGCVPLLISMGYLMPLNTWYWSLRIHMTDPLSQSDLTHLLVVPLSSLGPSGPQASPRYIRRGNYHPLLLLRWNEIMQHKSAGWCHSLHNTMMVDIATDTGRLVYPVPKKFTLWLGEFKI